MIGNDRLFPALQYVRVFERSARIFDRELLGPLMGSGSYTDIKVRMPLGGTFVEVSVCRQNGPIIGTTFDLGKTKDWKEAFKTGITMFFNQAFPKGIIPDSVRNRVFAAFLHACLLVVSDEQNFIQM